MKVVRFEIFDLCEHFMCLEVDVFCSMDYLQYVVWSKICHHCYELASKRQIYFGMIGTTARDCFFEIKMILLMIDIISTLWNSNDYHCYSIWVFLYKLNGFWRAIEELWSVLGCAPEIKMLKLNWGWADLRIRGNVCRL